MDWRDIFRYSRYQDGVDTAGNYEDAYNYYMDSQTGGGANPWLDFLYQARQQVGNNNSADGRLSLESARRGADSKDRRSNWDKMTSSTNTNATGRQRNPQPARPPQPTRVNNQSIGANTNPWLDFINQAKQQVESTTTGGGGQTRTPISKEDISIIKTTNIPNTYTEDQQIQSSDGVDSPPVNRQEGFTTQDLWRGLTGLARNDGVTPPAFALGYLGGSGSGNAFDRLAYTGDLLSQIGLNFGAGFLGARDGVSSKNKEEETNSIQNNNIAELSATGNEMMEMPPPETFKGERPVLEGRDSTNDRYNALTMNLDLGQNPYPWKYQDGEVKQDNADNQETPLSDSYYRTKYFNPFSWNSPAMNFNKAGDTIGSSYGDYSEAGGKMSEGQFNTLRGVGGASGLAGGLLGTVKAGLAGRGVGRTNRYLQDRAMDYNREMMTDDYAERDRMDLFNDQYMQYYGMGFQDGGVPVSNRGMYEYPNQPVIVPSNNITMKGINHPVMAYPDKGNPTMMYPNQDYLFPNANSVYEVPVMQDGGDMTAAMASGRKITGTNQPANAEVENREFIQFPNGEIPQVEGKMHAQGGEKINLPEGSKVLSDNIKIGAENKKVFNDLFGVNLKANETYAKVMEKLKKKAGIEKLEKEQEKYISKVEKANDTKDKTTKNINLQLLNDQIFNKEQTLNEFKGVENEIFNMLFESQQARKESSDKNIRKRPALEQPNSMQVMLENGETVEAMQDGGQIRFLNQNDMQAVSTSAGNMGYETLGEYISDFGLEEEEYQDGGKKPKNGTTKKSSRKGKKMAVFMDGKWYHYGDSSMQDYRTHKSEKRKKAFYDRHAKNLKGDSPRAKAFRVYAKKTWQDGGEQIMQDGGQIRFLNQNDMQAVVTSASKEGYDNLGDFVKKYQDGEENTFEEEGMFDFLQGRYKIEDLDKTELDRINEILDGYFDQIQQANEQGFTSNVNFIGGSSKIKVKPSLQKELGVPEDKIGTPEGNDIGNDLLAKKRAELVKGLFDNRAEDLGVDVSTVNFGTQLFPSEGVDYTTGVDDPNDPKYTPFQKTGISVDFSSPVVEEPVVEDDPKEDPYDPPNVETRGGVRMLNVPRRLPPDPVMLGTYNLPEYDRMSPIKVSPETALRENARTLNVAKELTSQNVGSQQGANVANIISQIGNVNNQAVTTANTQNAQFKQQADAMNMQTQQAENTARNNALKAFGLESVLALDNTRRDIRSYIDTVNEDAWKADKEARSLNIMDAMYDNFTFDRFGNVIYQDTGDKYSYGKNPLQYKVLSGNDIKGNNVPSDYSYLDATAALARQGLDDDQIKEVLATTNPNLNQ